MIQVRFTHGFPRVKIPTFSGGPSQHSSRMLTTAELKKLLAVSGSPYIQLSQKSLSKAMLADLDALADKLSQIDVPTVQALGTSSVISPLPSFDIDLGGRPAQVRHLGSGTFGSVFKVTVGQQTMALKVFFKRHKELYYSGPYSEVALGMYITQHRVRNMPHLIAANPARGWIANEFIDEAFQRENNQGPTWQALQLKVFDTDVVENECADKQGNAYHVDYGAFTGPQRFKESEGIPVAELFGLPPCGDNRLPQLSLKQFKNAFDQAPPEKRILMLEHIGLLPTANRLAALKHGLNDPLLQHFPVAMFIQAKVLTSEQVEKIRPWLLRHKVSTLRALGAFLTKTRETSDAALPLRIAAGEHQFFLSWIKGNPSTREVM